MNAPFDEPRGFLAMARHVGIKPSGLDFTVIASEREAVGAAVLTRNRFCGAPVPIARAHAADHRLQAITVVSGNAAVADGERGERNVGELVDLVSAESGVARELVLPAATGVIGRPLPMESIRQGAHGFKAELAPGRLGDAAAAIMTTDRDRKIASRRVGDAVVTGMAKGAGMMAPNMATLLSFFLTDAAVARDELDALLKRVVALTYNRLSVDTDTSTSDTVCVLANGTAGPVDVGALEEAIRELALAFTREIARDGEGATKLLTVTVQDAVDDHQAEEVARAVVNSPLVKTAAFGADPNWGRVAMAVGKCVNVDLDPTRVVIAFGDERVFEGGSVAGQDTLDALEEYLRGEEVAINVWLGLGAAAATMYGCDLTYDYVRLNGEYTS